MFTRTLLAFAAFTMATAAFALDLDRAMILTPPTGTAPEDAAIATCQARAVAPHATAADFERLGWSFVAKARRTLDAGYYKLAAKTADVMDAQFGPSADAALLRGHVEHNLHRFRTAETIAHQLTTERGLPEDWALLSDALMEQGRLDEAVAALQRMENLKPGAEADTRIAHLRWLKGDLPGAIAAMADAVRSTSVTDRAGLAWMLAQMAQFQLAAGDSSRAGALATAAEEQLPDYAPALLAAGRVALARHDARAAVSLLRRAATLNPLPEYRWWLADAERAAGEDRAAAEVETSLCDNGAAADPRTFALYLATRHQDLGRAVELARDELAARQDAFTHDALAWALWAHGDTQGAHTEIQLALAEGTRDARLYLHAAAIAQSGGDFAAARQRATQCRALAGTLLPSERQLLDQLDRTLARASAPTAATQG